MPSRSTLRSSRRPPRISATIGVAAVLACGALASCGNGESSGAARATSTSPTTAAATSLFPNDPAVVMQLAAGAGHVVVTRPTKSGSDLIDVSTPGKPVVLRSLPGSTPVPTIGTDAAGKPVVVVSPCLPAKPVATPRCALIAVDLATRAATPVPGSRFAFIGDLDRGRAAVVRYAADRKTVRVALQSKPGSSAYAAHPIGAFNADVPTYAKSLNDSIGSIDLRGGVIAVSHAYGDPGDYGGSELLRSTPARTWKKLAGSGYGLMNGDRREWRAVTLTASGVRAVYDGGTNDDPYAARFSAAGQRAKRITLPSGFDVAYSAFDGDDLLRVNNGDFGFEGTPEENGVLRSGPYPLG